MVTNFFSPFASLSLCAHVFFFLVSNSNERGSIMRHFFHSKWSSWWKSIYQKTEHSKKNFLLSLGDHLDLISIHRLIRNDKRPLNEIPPNLFLSHIHILFDKYIGSHNNEQNNLHMKKKNKQVKNETIPLYRIVSITKTKAEQLYFESLSTKCVTRSPKSENKKKMRERQRKTGKWLVNIETDEILHTLMCLIWISFVLPK